MKTQRQVIIPFAGFYESRHDYELDREAESYAENEGLDESAVCSAVYKVAHWQQAHEYIARVYASQLVRILDREAGWGTRLRFAELDSPREYNFGTDRIFCSVPRSTVRRWRQEVKPDALHEVAAERHTSRSGFMSFYSPDVETWGRLESWDTQQLTTLFLAWLKSRDIDARTLEDDVHERMSGNGEYSNAFWHAVDEDELKAAMAKEQTP